MRGGGLKRKWFQVTLGISLFANRLARFELGGQDLR
jgi:hypothetical protein